MVSRSLRPVGGHVMLVNKVILPRCCVYLRLFNLVIDRCPNIKVPGVQTYRSYVGLCERKLRCIVGQNYRLHPLVFWLRKTLNPKRKTRFYDLFEQWHFNLCKHRFHWDDIDTFSESIFFWSRQCVMIQRAGNYPCNKTDVSIY